MQYCNTTKVSFVLLGRQGEHLAKGILFDEPKEWKEIYGAGEVQLVNQRPGEELPYVVALKEVGDQLLWEVTGADTAISGSGRCELRYLVGETLVKSRVYTTVVQEALGDDLTGTPEVQPDWINQLLTLGTRAENAAAKAEGVLADISAELAQAGQLTPQFADSLEECTDTSKLYVLPDGYLYAYMKYDGEGGVPLFTNLADPSDSAWQKGMRYNAVGSIVAANSADTASGAFVGNIFSCKAGDILRVKGVAGTATGASNGAYFRFCALDATGANISTPVYLENPPASLVSGNLCAGAVVNVTDDGVYEYSILQLGDGLRHDNEANIVSGRIAGIATGGSENIIITINEEIAYSETESGYQWQNTGVAFVPVTTTPASGARWFALGDSITEGWTSAVDETSDTGYKQFLNGNKAERWVNIVAEMNGYKLTNYGIGGTGYLQAKTNTLNARDLADTLDFSQCDFVTLAYGVNDWKYAVNIGSMEDDIAAGGSMVANMRYVIQKILSDNPLCKIFVITPINCRSYGTYATNWGINYAGGTTGALNGLGLEDIFALQKAVCEYHGVELIDMTHSSVVNRENIKALLADNIHPTVAAHRLMARELAEKINFR